MNDIDIKKIRENLGLTQLELAKKLGKASQTISNWETTGRVPSTIKKKLEEIAQEGTQRRDATDHVGRLLDIMEADRKTMNADRQFYQSEIQHNREQIDRLINIIEGRVAEERKKNVG